MHSKIENPEDKENKSSNLPPLPKESQQPLKTIKAYKKPQQKKTSINIPKQKSKIHSSNTCITPPLPKSTSKAKQILEIEKHYSSEESSQIFINYGESIYDYLKKIELPIPSSLLQKHPLSSSVHLKMIDWMIEVLSIYHSSEEAFFSAVNIMDYYISKALNLKTSNIHLIGITSMFISSKYEDVYPISLNLFVKSIGHNLFTQQEIKDEERRMLNVISIDSLISSTMYDYIKMIFFDFENNNKELIEKTSIDSLLTMMKRTSIYLIKMTLHFEFFYTFGDSAKAIACIMTALSVLKAQTKNFAPGQEALLLEWIQIIMRESQHPIPLLINLYTKIADCYENFHLLNTISQNLNKFYPLKLK